MLVDGKQGFTERVGQQHIGTAIGLAGRFPDDGVRVIRQGPIGQSSVQLARLSAE